ncbi:hypothetical protein Golob_004776 [Gossypium lobatum]|uniref:RNase H type-1 domain-containing protein n=1 Tax=Gossypium lobatum TaxID=34289 RepID=A0A7J8N2W1_9ROSI|nr:hypothetical protein [Gossypium lobatum]
MVIGDGAWNLDLFRLWLLEEVIRRIEEIPSPYSAAEVDRIIWGGTSTGSFFVKSAYEKLRESSLNPKEWLLTNMERVLRGLWHSTTCRVCGYISKDVTVMTIAWVMLIGNVFLGLSLGTFGRIKISSFFKRELCETEMGSRFLGLIGLGSCSILDADLWGILDGLVLLIDQGYDNMLIQTDTLEAVKAIKESPSNGSNSTSVRRIHPLSSWIGHWSVWHISR